MGNKVSFVIIAKDAFTAVGQVEQDVKATKSHLIFYSTDEPRGGTGRSLR